nr:MAG TPA: hypothetical protein [Caudoviricetes sp.]
MIKIRLSLYKPILCVNNFFSFAIVSIVYAFCLY